ncbi:MAG TPA: holin [Actinomycetaceae bacterium]|nr:holin [Actinomycetaceae bacterium]
MLNKKFAKDAAERAVKTAAQTSVALLTADGVMGLLDVDWGQGASVVGLAALVSLLTSVASAPAGDAGTASAVRTK